MMSIRKLTHIALVSVLLLFCFINTNSLLSSNGLKLPTSLQSKFVISVSNIKNTKSSTLLHAATFSRSIPLSPVKTRTNLFSKLFISVVAFGKLVINPAISGGLLAGSLHSVTGSIQCVYM